jgi:hypothetical protein
MKTKKLPLSILIVESFITSIEKTEANTLKGGSTPICRTTFIAIQNSKFDNGGKRVQTIAFPTSLATRDEERDN